ncbi:MAG: thioredoxin [Defluviitaleaceae bacterium]|nr:thioredoxin [Defluviitaleaceae bacterium]
MSVINITNENFEEEVMQSNKPILLDFWAEWCGPCKMIGPIIDEISKEQDAVKVGKVNVTDAPELAEKFGVQSIPLLLLMKNGVPVAHILGYKPKKAILEMLASYM